MSQFKSPHAHPHKSRSHSKILVMNSFSKDIAQQISKNNLFSPEYSHVDNYSSYSRNGKGPEFPLSTKQSNRYSSHKSHKTRGHSRSISHSKNRRKDESVNEYEISNKDEHEFRRDRAKMRFKQERSIKGSSNRDMTRESEMARRMDDLNHELDRYRKSNKRLKEDMYRQGVEAEKALKEMKKRIAYLEQKMGDNSVNQLRNKIERYKDILASEKERSNHLIRENNKLKEMLKGREKSRKREFSSSFKSNHKRNKSRKGSFINREESEYSDYNKYMEQPKSKQRSFKDNIQSNDVLPRSTSKNSRYHYDYTHSSKHVEGNRDKPNEYGRSRSKHQRRKSGMRKEHLVENFESFGLAPPRRNTASVQKDVKRI